MGERLLGSQVVETETGVLIGLAVIPQLGSQTCPGHPPSVVDVALAGPLGERTVRDGRSTGVTLAELLGR